MGTMTTRFSKSLGCSGALKLGASWSAGRFCCWATALVAAASRRQATAVMDRKVGMVLFLGLVCLVGNRLPSRDGVGIPRLKQARRMGDAGSFLMRSW